MGQKICLSLITPNPSQTLAHIAEAQTRMLTHVHSHPNSKFAEVLARLHAHKLSFCSQVRATCIRLSNRVHFNKRDFIYELVLIARFYSALCAAQLFVLQIDLVYHRQYIL